LSVISWPCAGRDESSRAAPADVPPAGPETEAAASRLKGSAVGLIWCEVLESAE
jgi:hypothetical protein